MKIKENDMLRYLCWIVLALGILFTARAARAQSDSVTFTVLPPDVSGPAGTTVGWGYSIANNSTTNYLDINYIDSTVFTNGISDSSPFLFSYSTLAPGATETQLYDPVNNLGLFQFTWNVGVATGTTDAGIFGLTGAFCNPSDILCATDLSVPNTVLATGDYTATVIPASGTPVFEPSSVLLLVSGLCAIGFGICADRKTQCGELSNR